MEIPVAKSEFFLDSVFAIALASPLDQYHLQAVKLAKRVESNGSRLITTRAVLLEIGNALSKTRLRPVGVQTLHMFHSDPMVEVIPLSEDLYLRGFELFRARTDKEWGLVDCVSFVVMQDRGLTEALTSDEHFEQAGFVALLRN